jgi:hypothetical protein
VKRRRRKPSRKAKAGPKSLLDNLRKASKAALPPTPEEQKQLDEALRDFCLKLAEGAGLLGPREPEPIVVPRITPWWERLALPAPAVEGAALSGPDWLSAELAQLKEAGNISTSATALAKLLEPRMAAAVRAGKCLEAMPWSSIRVWLYRKNHWPPK